MHSFIAFSWVMFLVSPVRKRRQTSWGLQHDVSFEPPYPDMFIDAIFMSMSEIGLHVVAAAVQSQLVALYERSPSMSPTGQDVHSSDETFVAVQHARGCLQHSTSQRCAMCEAKVRTVHILQYSNAPAPRRICNE